MGGCSLGSKGKTDFVETGPNLAEDDITISKTMLGDEPATGIGNGAV